MPIEKDRARERERERESERERVQAREGACLFGCAEEEE